MKLLVANIHLVVVELVAMYSCVILVSLLLVLPSFCTLIVSSVCLSACCMHRYDSCSYCCNQLR